MIKQLLNVSRNLSAKLSVLLMLLAMLCASCSENEGEEEEYPDWKNTNEAYFKSLASSARQAMAQGDKSWKAFLTYTKVEGAKAETTDSIFVHVVKEGTGAGCPAYTDSVKVHYRGRLIPSKSYPTGYVFDKTFEGDVFDPSVSNAAKFVVNSVVTGFATALMHMHIGDHWIVYMPYKLGYDITEKSGIPIYSTLIFEMQLVSYFRAGTPTSAKTDFEWNGGE